MTTALRDRSRRTSRRRYPPPSPRRRDAAARPTGVRPGWPARSGRCRSGWSPTPSPARRTGRHGLLACFEMPVTTTRSPVAEECSPSGDACSVPPKPNGVLRTAVNSTLPTSPFAETSVESSSRTEAIGDVASQEEPAPGGTPTWSGPGSAPSPSAPSNSHPSGGPQCTHERAIRGGHSRDQPPRRAGIRGRRAGALCLCVRFGGPRTGPPGK